MPKLKLLILDANVVIRLHELGLWQTVVAECDVHLSRIVIDDEVKYYHGRDRDKLVDLSPDVATGRVQVFEVQLDDIRELPYGPRDSQLGRPKAARADPIAVNLPQAYRGFEQDGQFVGPSGRCQSHGHLVVRQG